MFDHILSKLGRLTIFSVIFTVSISFAGLLYIDSFSRALGYNFSLFDLDFYNFLINVLVSDEYNLILNIIILFMLFIVFVFYPKALIFVFEVFRCSCVLIWSFLKIPYKISTFFLIYISPFLIPIFLIVLCLDAVIIKLKDVKKIKKHVDAVKEDLSNNLQYKEKLDIIKKAKKDFFSASILFYMILIFFLFWLGWVLYVGKQGQKHADVYIKSSEYKKVYLVDKTIFDAVFVSKVKNGYLFVLKDGEKNKEKASFIPDSAILRID